MGKKRDYYEVLGISKNATDDDIKHAYRLLAKRYHPDVSVEPNAEEKFKEINEAKEVLLDHGKRWMYDQYGFTGVDRTYREEQSGERQRKQEENARREAYEQAQRKSAYEHFGSEQGTGYSENVNAQGKERAKENQSIFQRFIIAILGFIQFVQKLFQKAINHYAHSAHMSLFHKVAYVVWLWYLKTDLMMYSGNYSQNLDGWTDFIKNCDKLHMLLLFMFGIQILWWIYRKTRLAPGWTDMGGGRIMIGSIILVMILADQNITITAPWYIYLVPSVFLNFVRF